MAIQSRDCLVCGAQSGLSYLCIRCQATLSRLIRQAGITVGDDLCLMDELDLTTCRQGQSGQRVGGRSANVPLPFDDRAAQCRQALGDGLIRWARRFGARIEPGCWAIAARWLYSMTTFMVRNPNVRVLYAELNNLSERAIMVMDRPEAKHYLGICSAIMPDGYCMADLYAGPSDQTITCSSCGTVHNVEERRAVLVNAAHDVLLNATDMARVLTSLGIRSTSDRIRKWRDRGIINEVNRDEKGHGIYSLQEILKILSTKA